MSRSAYDASLGGHVDAAAERLERTLRQHAPHLAPALLDWIRGLAPDGRIADYFKHEHRFPMLLLPWWMSDQAGIREDHCFQEGLVYSTAAGYLAARLLDDALDDGAEFASNLLPAAVILQSEFQHAHAAYFAGDHPFWELFRRQWYGAADFAFDHESAQDFARRVERRLGPALIPLAAVAYRADRLDLLARWEAFLRDLARFEQLLDDITDWLPDSGRQAPNWLLARYQGVPAGEPLAAWILREGLRLAYAEAESWLAPLRGAAGSLHSSGADDFLAARHSLLRRMREETDPGLRELARLRAAFDPA